MLFTILLCALLFSAMVVEILKKSKAKNLKRKLPPGPRQLPIIGNMHQLFGPLPHHTLRDLAKKYGPLMHLKLGEVSTVIVSSPEVAKEVFRTHDIIFAQRPYLLAGSIISYNFVGIGFTPYGEYWRQMRKICTMELLSAKRVQTFRSIREEEVFNTIASVDERSVVNISRKIFSLTYGITARAIFTKRIECQEKFISLVEEIVHLLGGFSIPDMYPSIKILEVFSGMTRKIETVHSQIDEILESIVNEHKEKMLKQEPGCKEEAKEDLVDVLLNIKNRGDFEVRLTDRSIKAVIFDIFSAGSETSSTTVEWALSEMIRSPEVMKRAQEEVREVFDGRGNVDESSLHELKYLQAIAKETLRLHPSAPLLVPRESSEQCEIHGYEIPSKTRVMVNAWAIGRDPMYWAEAEKFNPERFLDSKIDYTGTNFEYVPFGAGRRMCPGISFAIPNIELPLAQLLFHFDWKLPSGLKAEQLDMTESFGLAVRRKNDLHLIPTVYRRSCLKLNH